MKNINTMADQNDDFRAATRQGAINILICLADDHERFILDEWLSARAQHHVYRVLKDMNETATIDEFDNRFEIRHPTGVLTTIWWPTH